MTTCYKHKYPCIPTSHSVFCMSNLICFTAFGCSYPTAPVDGFINMQGDHAVITCKFSNAQWELKCKDGQWIGDFKDCATSKHTRILCICALFIIMLRLFKKVCHFKIMMINLYLVVAVDIIFIILSLIFSKAGP